MTFEEILDQAIDMPRRRGRVTYRGASWEGDIVHEIDELVPHREVQPSKDGRYWRCRRPSGERRCFFAPPPGS